MWNKAVLAGLTISWILLFAFLTGKRVDQLPDITFSIPANYMPGNPLPVGLGCDWYYYSMPIRSCSRDYIVYLSYDSDTGEIVRTSYLPKTPLKLGDLVLAWGQPIGIDQSSYGALIYWQGKSVYSYGRRFSPDSKIGLVAFDNRPQVFQPWQGFRQAK